LHLPRSQTSPPTQNCIILTSYMTSHLQFCEEAQRIVWQGDVRRALPTASVCDKKYCNANARLWQS
jgi:hypothetical protein